MRRAKPGRWWRVALFVGLLAATALFLAPGDALPPTGLPLADKVAHVAVFSTLAVLARRGYLDQPPWGVFAALVIYGAAVEWAQRDVPGRGADAFDLAADALGAAIVFFDRPR